MGTPAIDYDLIADPPLTDQLLGIQSPAGTWDLARYSVQALMDLAKTQIQRDTYTATAANTFAIGEVGFLAAAGTITKAQADDETTTKNMLVMATAAIDGGAAGVFALSGEVTVTAHGFTVGAPLFISAATAGAITNTAPDTSTNQLRTVGYAVDTNTIRFAPSLAWSEVP